LEGRCGFVDGLQNHCAFDPRREGTSKRCREYKNSVQHAS